MPKIISNQYLKLHYQTWVVRYQIPKDCQAFFEGKREYICSTGFKESEIIDARLVRDQEIATIKRKIRDIRKGRYGNTPTIEEAKERLSSINQAQSKSFQNGLDLHASELVDDVYQDLINQHLANGMQAIAEHAQVIGSNNISEILGDLNPDVFKKVEKEFDQVTGKAFNSHLDSWLNTRDVKALSPKFQSEHLSKVNLFSQDFPSVRDVTRQAVKQWTRKLEDEGKASTTITKTIQILEKYWTYLRDEIGSVEEESYPFSNHTFASTKKLKRKTFTVEDARRLIEQETFQTRKYPYLPDFISLGFLTGCRIKELCEIKKKNIISFENLNVIDITEEMTKGNTRGVRKLPITPQIEKIIERRLEEADSEYLFTGNRNKFADRTGHMSKRFSHHKSSLGYEKKTQVAHSFRHTANTLLAKKEHGVTKTQREALFGWSDGTNKSMADGEYQNPQVSYPMNERLKDLKKLGSEFYFLESA